MAKTEIYNYDGTTPAQITREHYENVGASAFNLGNIRRAFFGGADFEIWDSDVGGTQLVENVDYSLGNLDNDYTDRTGKNVYTEVTILTAGYQSGSIYITYKAVGTYTDIETLQRITPIGGIVFFPGGRDESIPTIPGFLPYLGGEYSRTTYSELFTVIGCRGGIGDGSTTFNVGDPRGRAIRVPDFGAGRDPDTDDRAWDESSFNITGNTSSGSDIITNISSGDMANLFVDLGVSGTGIPAGAVIIAIPSTTTVQISASATATNSGITIACELSGDYPGTVQDDEIKEHRHAVEPHVKLGRSGANVDVITGGTDYTSYYGGDETRMKNFGLIPYIRYGF